MSASLGVKGLAGALGVVRAASRLGPSLRPNAPFLIAVRNHWNKDYKPGPYPQTPEERRAAAKKYNLPEEWYNVYPDDGMGYGDYPKLPLISTEARDDFYPWDYPEMKRNYDELLHVEEEIINDARFNVNAKHLVPIWEQVLWLLGVISLSFGLYIYLEDYDRKVNQPVLSKQFPKAGMVHYTFEPQN